MGRFPNFRQTVDECLTLSITQLKANGFLSVDDNIKGGLRWILGKLEYGNINVIVYSINSKEKILNLNYLDNGQEVNYNIQMVAMTTNLKNGIRWYFVCPQTGRKCIKIIRPNGSKYFLHRTAFDLIYDSQKQSKGMRELENTFGHFFKIKKLDDQLNQKYRKKYYRGKPTPLLKKIMRLEEKLCLSN